MNQPLPLRIKESFSAEEMEKAHGDLPANASYRYLDQVEMIHTKRLSAEVAEKYPNVEGVPIGFERAGEEMKIEFAKWHQSGAFTFSIGPETTARIEKRLKDEDVPTSPVPPAYFQFDGRKWKYDRDKPLMGAFLSRGATGKIVFVSDETSEVVDPTVIALPSVFRAKSLSILKRSMQVHRAPKLSNESIMLAKNMIEGSADGRVADERSVKAMAAHIENMRPANSEEIQKDPCLDVSGLLANEAFGPLKGNPGNLLMRAAKVVLIAADEARQFDEDYAKPQYHDENMVMRNQLEDTQEPVERRSAVVMLP